MRALLAVVVAVVTSSAAADPIPRKPDPAEALRPQARSSEGAVASTADAARTKANPSRCSPGMACVIIDPGPFADARPYPRGMVIAPPDTGDRMANPLEPWWRSMSRELWQRLDHGLAALRGSLQPASL